MLRKHKAYLIGLSFAFFILLLSTATLGATMPVTSFSESELFQPEAANSLAQLPPPPGMVSYWEFNEGGGVLASDSIGINDGTLRDGGMWVPGIAGTGVDLAPHAYVECGGDPSLSIQTLLTIEAWVMLPDTQGIRTIVQNGNDIMNKMYHFAIEDGFLYFDRYNGSNPANVYRSHIRMNPGEWHHVAVLMDEGMHELRFYIDDVMDPIGGFNDPYTGVPYSRLTIGYGQDPMTGHSPTFFNGFIDEVAVYDALLSHDDILQHFHNGQLGLGYLDGGIQEPLEAVDDSFTTDEDVLLNVAAPGVLINDIGDGLTADLEAGPSSGSLSFYSDGSFQYNPFPNSNGVDTFTYSMTDGFTVSNIATVTITVNAVNDAPVGVDDSYAIDEDTPLDLVAPGILENDSDIDEDSLVAVLVDAPLHGSVDLNADGSLSYIPDADWYGTDYFTYQAFDGTDYSGIVTVTIEVSAVDDAPRAQDDFYNTDENVPLIIDALSGVLVNDTDPDGDLLASQIVTAPSHGSLDFNVDGSFTYTPDPDWYGIDTFVYEAIDGMLLDAATVTITVIPVNKPPVAIDDFYTTNEDIVLNIDVVDGVLANDTDENGDVLTAVLMSQPSHGLLVLSPDGSFTYTPDPDWYGVDSFDYEVSDGELTDVGTVTITVNSINDRPVALDDTYVMDEDGVLVVNSATGVLANDYDVDGDALEAYWVEWPINGELDFNLDGSFTYTPNPDYWGIDSFTYLVYDGIDASEFATVTITINAVQDAPVAVDDFYSIDEDTELSTYSAGIAGVVVNDYDGDGDPLEAVLVGPPLYGTISFDTDGNFLYVPDANFYGTDSFTYYLSDGVFTSNTATVTITVNSVNDYPVAVDDMYLMDEDDILVVDSATGILANDYDVDGDVLEAYFLDLPSNGILSLNLDGSFTYTPNPDFWGTDFFTYLIYDGIDASGSAKVTITVNAVNDAPIADDDTYSTNEDIPLSVPAPGVLAGDTDVESDPLTTILETGPANGMLILNSDGSFDYFPDPDFFGTDAFTYMAHDGQSGSNIATVTIDVIAVNDAPVANDDEYQMDEDAALSIPAPGLLSNDYDVDGDIIFVDDWSDPGFGQLIVYPDGAFEFIPDSDWNGVVSFEYWVFDGLTHSNVVTVTIIVHSVNDAPIAIDDFYTTDEDIALSTYSAGLVGVLANDLDVDGDPLVATLMESPLHGYLAFGPDGNFDYIPDANFWGTDWFTYYIFDGLEASDLAMVTITVNSVNDAPVAIEDEYQIDEDGELIIPAPGLLSNDYDIEGDLIIVDDWSDPASGNLVVYEDGSFEFIPDPDWNGVVAFEYWVFDGLAHSNVVTVTIIVNPVNDAPVAVDDFYSTNEDTELSTYGAGMVGVLANDYDVDGDSLEIQILDQPSHGAFIPDPDGNFDYIPDADFWGTDFFTYYLSDGILTSNVATVAITVNPVNDAPVAVNDYVELDEDTVIIIDVLANDYDVDGDPIDVLWMGGDVSAMHGPLSWYWYEAEPGVFRWAIRYQPNPNFYGVLPPWYYGIGDPSGADSTAIVYITVNSVLDAPVAVDDEYTIDEDTMLQVDVAGGILSNDSDGDGDSLEAILESGPANGILILNLDGSFTYTPNANFFGADLFTYRASDGVLQSDITTVTITVNPVNDAPVAMDDFYSIDEDTELSTYVAGIAGVLGNDYDVDGDILEAVLVEGVTHGYLTIDWEGNFGYMPGSNFFGTDTFTYYVFDGSESSSVVTVTITVNSVNDAPVAFEDEYQMDEDGVLSIPAPGLLGNDYDVDGDFIFVDDWSDPASGNLVVFEDGSLQFIPDPNWNGVVEFEYWVFDGHVHSNVVTVTIHVLPVNDAPVAVNDYAELDEDTVIIIDVLANDYDVDDDPIDVLWMGGDVSAMHGQLSWYWYEAEPGVFRWAIRYQPHPNFYGVLPPWYYGIGDPSGADSTATVYITVNSVLDAPVAMDDEYAIDEDTVLQVDAVDGVIANDSDNDGDILSVYLVSGMTHGSLVFNADGSFTYTPDANWYGVESFIYEVSDGTFSDTATVTITVNPVDDPPVAVDDYVTTDEDTPITIDVLANDYDIDGDPFDLIDYYWSPAEPRGELTLVDVGGIPMIQYTPDLNWYGSAWFTYDIGTTSGHLSTAHVYITVNSVEDAPVAVDDVYSIDEDGVLQVDGASGVLANDYDGDGDSLALELVSSPSHGSLLLNPDGSFIYTPDANWFGVDSFIYEISDGDQMDTATVTITVNPVDDPPVAVDDYVTTDEDTPITIDVLANDYDIDGDPFDLIDYYWSPAEPRGELTLVDVGGIPMIQYTPDLNWYGSAWFTYDIGTTSGHLSTAHVYITVNPVNDAPVGVDDEYTIDEDGSLNLPAPGVLTNDYDVDGDTITATLVSAPQGSGSFSPNGALNYYPPANWHGVTTLTYKVFDGTEYSDIVTVTITVNSVNDAPVGVDEEYTIDEDTSLNLVAPGLLANDYDVDGDTITLVVVTAPSHGSGSIGSDGSFSYTPYADWYGTDSMTYQVFDGTDYSGIVTVTITVNPVNDAPVGVDDEYTIDEDGSLNLPAPGVLTNDYDVDGDSLSAILVSPPYGSSSFSPNGALTYNPPANWHGVTTLTYRVFDGTEYSDIVTVTINVNSVNDAPVGVNDDYTIDEDTSLNLVAPGLLANDYDVDGDTITLVVVTVPSHGSGSIGSDGSFSYTPYADWYGTDSMTYQAFDGGDYSGIVTVTITVNSVNDAPVAVDDYVVTDEDTPILIDFMGNDYDVDGSFGWDYVAWVPTEINGEMEIVYDHEVEPGVFRDVLRYTPNPDWYGSISTINYRLSDTFGAQSSIARIYITVNPVNDAPVAVDDYVTADEDTSVIIDFMGNDYDVDDSFTFDYASWSTSGIHGELIFLPDYEIEPGIFRWVVRYTPDSDWHGTASVITYGIKDSGGLTSTAQIFITVNSVNDPPVAVDDYVVTDEDTSVIIDFMANDYDIDSSFDWYSITRTLSELHGTADILHNYEVEPGVFRTVISYTPDPNWYGSTSAISYDIWDSEGAVSATAYIHITVNSVNDAPVGVDDSYTIDEDTPLILPAPGVLANDYDVDGDSITLDLQTHPQYGNWAIGSNGLVNYYPPANWYGTDSFTYRVFDGTAYSGTVTVTITVEPVNDAPVAVDDYVTLDEDTSVIIDFMLNDYDIDSSFDWNTITRYPSELHGTADILYKYEISPGVFRTVISYTPDPNWHGSTSAISYTIRDSEGAVSATAYIHITVNSVNDAPVGVDDSYTIDEDTSLNLPAPGVLANDYDVDGDAITLDLVTYPQHGDWVIGSNGLFNYYPAANWYGTDSFTYRVFDGTTYSEIVTVAVTVRPVNDAPVAVDDYVVTDEDTSVIIDFMANDYDIDSSFDWYSITRSFSELHGTADILHNYEVEPGVFRTVISYTPDPDWYGSTSAIYYDIWDSEGAVSATAYIHITVNSVNDAPVGVDDSYTIDEDTSLNLAAPGVLANDYDVDGDAITLDLQTHPQHGDWVIGSNGFFDYEPFDDWHGTDSFTYRVFDGTAYSGIVTVTITVEPVNDAPVAKDDAYTTGEDVVLVVDAAIGVIANDDDIDGDALSAQIVSGASHGNLVFNADGSFTYTPDGNWFGEDFFTYEVTDGTFTDTATVTIKVLSVNDAPVAVNDTCSTLEDVTLIIEPPGVLANDFDIDGDPLTTVLLDMPLHGIVSLEPDGAFTYIPDQDYYGFDIFTYQVFDGTEYSDKAFVIIEVIYVNTPPTAYNDVYTTEEGVSLIVEAPGVLANDVDVDEEDILEAMLVDAPMHGMLVLLPDGWFNYTPDAAWCGVDTFTYYAFDGLEYSNIATVTITVVDVTPPVTTIQFVGDAGEYHWYYSDVEVTMTATDDCSGVASTLYSVNGSEWMPYIDSFVLTNPGEYIIRYYSMDNAGNIEDTHTAAAKISKYTRGYVTGAGWILEADGSKDFFSILVKYRRCGSLYGHINYMFKDNKHLHALKVKGSQILGLIIEGNHAIIEAKGVVYRTGCRCHYYHYSEVFYLRIEVWDNGKGKSDVFQIRIFDEAGDLFHEAGFDPPGTLLRGSILIGPRHWYCWCRDWW